MSASPVRKDAAAGPTGPQDGRRSTTSPAAASIRRLRRFPRHATVEQALLVADGVPTPIVIENRSVTGVLVSGCTGLAEGQRIHLLLGDGDDLSGVVRWSRGERAGVEITSAIHVEGLGWVGTADASTSAAADRAWSLGALFRRFSGRAARRSRPSAYSNLTARMIERAIRRQGHGWLVDPDDRDHTKGRAALSGATASAREQIECAAALLASLDDETDAQARAERQAAAHAALTAAVAAMEKGKAAR